MFKKVQDKVCCFDCEWVPDLGLARRMYGLELKRSNLHPPPGMTIAENGPSPEQLNEFIMTESGPSDADVLNRVYQEAGATEENPKPFIKPILCSIVSIACVTRDFTPASERPLSIWSTSDNIHSEAKMIDLFLNRVGTISPQLVGWNSSGADLPILMQRAIANGVQAKGFFERPDKPWSGRDYFARYQLFLSGCAWPTARILHSLRISD
jgi:predicted PolB exonuclease-like 3'-5' exonuclease